MKSLRLRSQYISLSAMQWTDIPPLAILTGLNGVGKTQLLRLLASSSGAGGRGGYFRYAASTIELEPPPRSMGYLPALWELSGAKVSREFFKPVEELTQALENLARQSREPVTGEEALSMLMQRLEAIAVSTNPATARLVESLRGRMDLQSPITRAGVLAQLRPYELVTPAPTEPLVALAQIFYAHVNARVTSLLNGVTPKKVDKLLGIPPWDQANHLLRRFEVSFELTMPDDLRFDFELECRLLDSEDIIHPRDLSSGEQAVLALVALTVTTSVLGTASPAPDKTELLLLDEPDAHLHTSRVRSYLEHLQQLTERGVQIIMITHRPDTIALAPDESLFEMCRVNGTTSIAKVTSKAEIIGRLAADTVAVLPGVRVVLVEDEADRHFHQWAYDRALELGLLPANPRLVFMPVNAKGGGGKDAVVQRLEVLRREGLGAVHRGLVDHDHDTGPEPPGVIRLDRYTLENYLADPIALYCAVVNSRGIDGALHFSEAGGVARGKLSTLRSRDAATLQPIANLVLAKMEHGHALADRVRRSITLHGDTGAVPLEYPAWLFTATKNELRAAIGNTLDKAVLGVEHFHSGPEWAGLVPDDLVGTYRRLVTDRS